MLHQNLTSAAKICSPRCSQFYSGPQNKIWGPEKYKNRLIPVLSYLEHKIQTHTTVVLISRKSYIFIISTHSQAFFWPKFANPFQHELVDSWVFWVFPWVFWENAWVFLWFSLSFWCLMKDFGISVELLYS